MPGTYVIALDTHCSFTEVGVLSPAGRWRSRGRCATTIKDLRERVKEVRGAKEVVLEEGPLADWIARGLASAVEKVTVCDPRRNHLIAKDSDKDDPIDAEKLARLFRGGYVKPVHHPASFDRVVFKRHVGLYHDAVRERVRNANRVMAELRQYGVFVKERAFSELAGIESRKELLTRLPAHALIRADLERLFRLYDAAATHVRSMRRSLIQHARREPQIVRFTKVPGMKWIRASTFFAYVDTPWRFRSKQALWKYLGIGLERRRSGGGRELLRVPWEVNGTLKSAILGAARTAIVSRDNSFAEQYERWIAHGLTLRIARDAMWPGARRRCCGECGKPMTRIGRSESGNRNVEIPRSVDARCWSSSKRRSPAVDTRPPAWRDESRPVNGPVALCYAQRSSWTSSESPA